MKQIRIAEPCTVDWKKMTPAEGGRFCGDCKKVVKNLSSMTEREAKKLLRTASDGQLCVRFLYDAQGKIFFGADAPKADALLPSSLLSRAKRFAAAASFAVATQACGGETDALAPAATTKEAQETKQAQQEEAQQQDDARYLESMGGAPASAYDEDAGSDGDAGPADVDAGPADVDAGPGDLDGGAAEVDATAPRPR